MEWQGTRYSEWLFLNSILNAMLYKEFPIFMLLILCILLLEKDELEKICIHNQTCIV